MPYTPLKTVSTSHDSGRLAEMLPVLFRWLVVAAQVATILVTWKLWQTRTSPPLLPVVELPQFGFGWLMLVSACAVLVTPRWGLIAHACVVFVAMLLDQTRMQPEIVSHCFLLLGTLPSNAARLIGRMHLISLWLFSGMHKLLSPAFYDDVAPYLWHGVTGDALPGAAQAFGVTLALTEIGLGLLAMFVRTRRIAAVAAIPFHLGVLASLVHMQWNEAVWPWNVALAGAGMGLLFDWREALLPSFRAVQGVMRAVAALVLVAPASYYFGGLDAYMAHCLYSGNTPRGYLVRPGIRENLTMLTIDELKVPFPPTHRTYRDLFLAIGKPGDRLLIEDPRPCACWWGYDRVDFEYPK